MIKNYLLIALRNFRRNKVFSMINILGLSIGLSASLVIYLIVHYELSFDRFEKDGDRIYRVVTEFSFQGSLAHNMGVPAPLGDAINRELPGPDQTAALRYFNVQRITVPGKDPGKPAIFRKQKNVVFTDGHYFDLLPYKWLAGSAELALKDQGRVVLSESRAKLYFPSMGYSDMIGRKVIYEDSISTVVSGIVRDLDAQGSTDFSFREFISLPTILGSKGLRGSFFWDEWGSSTSDQQLFIRLQPGVSPSSVEAGLKTLSSKYLGKDAAENHYTESFLLQPLSDIHFSRLYGTFTMDQASKPALYGLLLVAAFLLFLGCINFINLTTAQAAQRAKEIGIRKTMGGSRKQLILQFLSETFVITVLATVLSLAMTPLLLKIFAGFVPKALPISMGAILRQPHFILFLSALVCCVTLLAGFYPALVLSSSKAVLVLKNQAYTGTARTRKAWIRQSLTVFQFFIAQAFVMSTLLVGKQIRFLLNKDMGFSKEAILSIKTPSADTSCSKRLYLLRNIGQIPGVALSSLGNDVPSSGNTWGTRMVYRDGKKEVQTNVEQKFGDTNYLRIFHIPLLAGRELLPSDTIKELLINESYLHLLGFRSPGESLGKNLKRNGNDWRIVGVMRDFYAHSLGEKGIQPLAFSYAGRNCGDLHFALQPASAGSSRWKAIITKMEQVYERVYPEEEFSYSFFDESIARFYSQEQSVSDLLKWSAGLTVFISCLGLLGLVVYTTNSRTKEIGVRKVLGASVAQIVSILSKDFLKLVCIAFVLATPVAWWALHRWMENFVLRTEVSWWVFALSGLGMIAIALITLSVQTIRAAMANPVNSLRSE